MKKNIIIYGTGEVAGRIYQDFISGEKDKQVSFFLDSLVSKKSFYGKNVYAPSYLDEIDANNFLYYLGTYTNTKSMKEELFAHGIKKENIIEVEDYAINSFEKNIKSIGRIIFFPEFESEEDLAKIACETRYLFPAIFNTGLVMEASGNIEDKYQDKHIHKTGTLSLDKEAIILVWDKTFLKDNRLKNYNKVLCIDRLYFDIIDIRIFIRLNYLLEEEGIHNELDKISRKNMTCLSGKFQKAYVTGNGPSCIEGLNKISVNENSLRIACNYFIKNKDYMDLLKPNMYVIADEVMAGENASLYIDMIMEYVAKQDCFFVAPREMVMVFIRRYPTCKDKVISIGLNAKTICFPSEDNLQVYRKAYNVITALAIPMASALCGQIYIMGCDGMKIEEDSWEYASGLNVENKIKRNVEVDNWYKQYYKQHIAYMEEVIRFGESKGKRYYNISKSLIPILNQINYIL